MDTVKSADRVMSILVLLAKRVRPVPAAMIARECGLPRSSTYQLLNAMRARQFVRAAAGRLSSRLGWEPGVASAGGSG
jgi:DNA-binding IclR family transcriptional regulator